MTLTVLLWHTATSGGYAVTHGYQPVATNGFDSPPAYTANPNAPPPIGHPAPPIGNQLPPYYYAQAPRGPPQQVRVYLYCFGVVYGYDLEATFPM